MKRRKFIRSAFGIIALIPFVNWKQEYKMLGVDKSIGKDWTEIIILDNPLSDQEFQQLKSSFLRLTIEGKVRCIPLYE